MHTQHAPSPSVFGSLRLSGCPGDQAGDDLVTAHTWLPGSYHAACTAGGRLLIQQEGDDVALLSHGLGVLTAMAALPQGLVVGDSAGGVAIFGLSASQHRSASPLRSARTLPCGNEQIWRRMGLVARKRRLGYGGGGTGMCVRDAVTLLKA